MSNQYAQDRLLQVLLGPVISEKSTYVGEKNNDVVFRVVRDATKPEIKAAVELLFSTKDKPIAVKQVRVANVKGKEKRHGRQIGRRDNWKKAYVSLAEGSDINFQVGE
jgi:large subunit ribosomal protein L23